MIDGKKIIRRGFLAVIAAVVGCLAAVNLSLADVRLPSRLFSAEKTVEVSFPAMRGFSEEGSGVFAELSAAGKKLFSFVLSFDVSDPRTVVFGEIPLVRAVSSGYLASTANEETLALYNSQTEDSAETEKEMGMTQGNYFPIKEVDSSQTKAMGNDPAKILIRNETAYSVNVDGMLAESLKFRVNDEGPAVLIVHTHATESYSPEGELSYDSDKSDRSMNRDENMVAVGEKMKQVFESYGIRVIHDETLHDYPNFNGSYENSRKTVENLLEQYPGISVVLDVHRDAFVYEDGSKAKFVTEIDGKKVAQLMFVVGTDAGGLNHPEWRENMKLALKFQNAVNQKYPTLMRGVNLRKERFNGHTAPGSMIIEVGSSGNTLEEAIAGATYGAEVMADFLNGLR